MTDLILYFDGACEPHNPGGWATYGWLVKCAGEVLASGHGLAAQGAGATNNVAEYAALCEGLEGLLNLGLAGEPVEVRGDSQLVIHQMAGEWRVHSARLRPLHQRGQGLVDRLGSIRWQWVPRERNAEADALSRVAYRQARGW